MYCNNNMDRYYAELQSAVTRARMELHVLEYITEDFPLVLVRPTYQNRNAPNLLVAAGFHGNEIAGVWGVIKFIQHEFNKLNGMVNLSFLPLVNPTGFMLGTRENYLEQDPNRGFCHTQNLKSEVSLEGRILLNHIGILSELSREGFLSLHEDLDNQCFYLYTFEYIARPGQFTSALLKCGQTFFPLCDRIIDGEVRDAVTEIKKGLVFCKCDGSFEDFLFHFGIPKTATVEIPGLANIQQRINASVNLIKVFVQISTKIFMGK